MFFAVHISNTHADILACQELEINHKTQGVAHTHTHTHIHTHAHTQHMHMFA
jgi:hypothetical protein